MERSHVCCILLDVTLNNVMTLFCSPRDPTQFLLGKHYIVYHSNYEHDIPNSKHSRMRED